MQVYAVETKKYIQVEFSMHDATQAYILRRLQINKKIHTVSQEKEKK
jgi:hypothetical protein